MSRKILFFVTLLTIASMVLAACGSTPTPTPTAVPPTATKAAAPAATTAPAPAATTAPAPAATSAPAAAPTATKAPAAAATTAPVPGEDYSKAARKDTIILDDDSGRVADPLQFNSWVPGARIDQGVLEAMIEPLQILNYETGKYVPWLAETVTSNDKLDVWTVKLRKGIYWSDGLPMNADDVVFTMQLILKTSGWAASASLNVWVKDVTKIDDLTTQFTLKNPNPRFAMDYLNTKTSGSAFRIMPKHIWDGQDALTFKNYDKAKGWPVYSGAYKLYSSSETEFVYVRDDNWWGYKTGFSPLPAAKKLIWVVPGPEETRTALMASGQLDVLGDITFGAFTALKAKNANVVAWYDKEPYASLDPCPRNLEFNTTAAPWNDKDMRWAINYVIDRDQVVKIAYENTTAKAESFFPAFAPLNRYVAMVPQDIRTKYTTTNLKAAADILTQKGYVKKGNYYQKDGKDLTLEIQTHEAYIELQRIADLIGEQLQKFGINAVTKRTAAAAFSDNFALGNFEARLGWQTCGSVAEPWFSMDTLNASYLKPVGERASNNMWRWNNAAYSKLVDQIGVLPLGDPKIDDLFKQAMAIYYDELPVITVTQAKKLVPVDTTYWKNWPTSSNNYMQPFMWWQSAHMMWSKLQPAK